MLSIQAQIWASAMETQKHRQRIDTFPDISHKQRLKWDWKRLQLTGWGEEKWSDPEVDPRSDSGYLTFIVPGGPDSPHLRSVYSSSGVGGDN